MDFVRLWSEATEIKVGRFVEWLGVTTSKFYNWRERYGRVNEHNAWVPRDFWLENVQPPQAHQHWHVDVSYINIAGTFYYVCSVLDGFSRFIVHWDLRESMTEADIEIILQVAKEKYPQAETADHLR